MAKKNPNINKGSSDRNAQAWRSKFKDVKNIAKNIGGMTLGEIAPGITETYTSSSDALRDTRQFISKARNQIGYQANSLNGNSPGRKARSIIKEALEDLKNGSYGLDKMSDESYDLEDDFDADIRDADSQITSTSDPDTVAMFETRRNSALLGKTIAHGNATMVEGLGRMSKTLANTALKASQAQTAQLTNVMLTSMNSQNHYMGMMNNKLDAINTNLVNIIDYNNSAQTEFYQKTAEYQSNMLEMMSSLGESIAKIQDVTEGKARKEDEFDFSNGFNLNTYKNMVRKNIDNSMLGMIGSVGSMAGMMGNPITMMLPMVFGALVPGFIKKPIERFDKSFTKGMENLLYRLGDKQYEGGILGTLGEFLGKERPSIAKLNMGNYKKDAMSWNGKAQKYLTEVIPSYLAKIESGVNGTPERYFHEGKGHFMDTRALKKDFQKSMTNAYEFSMQDAGQELDRILKKNKITGDEADLIKQRINNATKAAVHSSSGNRGKNQIRALDTVRASLHGKADENAIADLVHLINDGIGESVRNISHIVDNMETSYRQLYNQDGRRVNLGNQYHGDFTRGRKFTLSGIALDDIEDEAERNKAERDLDRKDGTWKKKAVEKALKIRYGSNWKSNPRAKAVYDYVSGNSKKANVFDRFSNNMYYMMTGTTGKVDLDAIEEQMAQEFQQWRDEDGSWAPGTEPDNPPSSGGGSGKGKRRRRNKANVNINQSNQSYSGRGWSAQAETALTKTIPNKLDKIEKAILKLDKSGFSSPGSATGQSSGTKPTGGNNGKFGLITFKEALGLSSDSLQERARKTQSNLNGNSKGNEAGPTSGVQSSADVIADRLVENENSLSNLVRATNDNFMAPMVGGIFGKDGMIRRFFSKDNLKSIRDKLFDEKDGIFKGVGSWFKDQMDYVKYVFTGKGYTNRKGVKYEESKNSVFDHIANGYDWVYQKTMQHLFGEDFKSNDKFQKYFQRFDFKSRREAKRNERLGLTTTQSTNTNDIQEIDERIDEIKTKINNGTLGEAGLKKANKELNELYHKRKKLSKVANQTSAKTDIQEASHSVGKKLREAGDSLVNNVIGKTDDKTLKDDQKKFGSKYKEMFKKFLPVGIAGAVVGGTLGLLGSAQGTGAVAPLFFSGGPIAGAVLGISATLLARSDKFQKVLFGEKDEDGNRKNGLISQKTQNFFKKNAPLLVGGAALGALKGVFKTAVGGGVVGGPGGFLLNTLLPGGIIGGAVMGLGISLLKSSDRFTGILFGNKGEKNDKKQSKGITKKLTDAFEKSGHFVKGGLKGLAIGAGSGVALGSMGVVGGALSLGGPVGMGLLGLGLGIASQADRAKELLFGTEEYDEKGNSKGRRKNGLFPRMRNYLVMNVFEPLKSNLQEKTEDFAFWLKKKITYPFRLAFGPIIDSFREIRKNISDTIKNVFENVGLSITKAVKTTLGVAFKPITKAFKKVGQHMTNVAFTGAKLALSPLSIGLNLVKFGSRNLRKRAMGERTKTLWQHAGDIYRGVRDVTKDQWANDDREYLGGPLGKIDRFITHGRDIFRNTRQGIDAAKAAYNKGMTQQGFNSLGWMNVKDEMKHDKELRKQLKGERKQWKGIDEVRNQIARENNHSEIFASGEQLKEYKKRLKKSGLGKLTNFIQTNADLNDLLYNKEDFLDRIKNGDKNIAKNPKETSQFFQKTRDYQNFVMDRFDVITKAFMKYATQNAIARRKNLSIQNLSDIDKNLRQSGLSWEDIGIDPGSLADVTTMSNEDWETYMKRAQDPDNTDPTKFNTLILEILQRQRDEAEKNGEETKELNERFDSLLDIELANAKLNASEQVGDTGASASDISRAAGHDFGTKFDDPITRHKKEQEKAAQRAKEAAESEAARKGHKSSQDEDKDKEKEEKESEKEEKEDKKGFLSGIWSGFKGLMGGIGGLFGSEKFWKAAGITTIAAATFGPWAHDIFKDVAKFLKPVTDFLGEKLKDGAHWLQQNMPNIVQTMTSNIVNNMGFVVDSVWEIAKSLTTTIGKKAVNSIFKFFGNEPPFPEAESQYTGRKEFATEAEAQAYAKETGRNVDGKVSYADDEYVDSEGNTHRVKAGAHALKGTAVEAAARFGTSKLQRKTFGIATGAGKLALKGGKFILKHNPVTGIPIKIGESIFKGGKNFLAKKAASGKGIGKILAKIEKGLKSIGGKATKILKLKKSDVWDSVCIGIIKAIEKVFAKNPELQAKLAEKVVWANAKGLSKFFLPVGIALSAYDAVYGAIDAAYLFGVAPEDVNGKMRSISALINVISGLPIASWFDLIAEVIHAAGGGNFKQMLARGIYHLLPGDDQILDDAIDRFELEYENYKASTNTNLKSVDEYNELVNDRNMFGFRKNKIDRDANIPTDEELTNYQRNKYQTKNYTNKSNAQMNPDNTVFYQSVRGTDVAVQDPSNVGFGPGDRRGRSIGYGLSQSDPRWANFTLGKFPSGRTSTMATGGCGPTALSMVASNTSPLAVAKDAKSGGYIKDGGATADLFTKGAKKYGLNASTISRGGLEGALKSGRPTIISGKSSGNGPYTENGHVVVAHGMDNRGNAIVNDPMRGTRKIKASELSKGMTHGWSYSRNAVGYGSISNNVKNLASREMNIAKRVRINTGDGAMFYTSTSDKVIDQDFVNARRKITKGGERSRSMSIIEKFLDSVKNTMLKMNKLVEQWIPQTSWTIAVKQIISRLLKLAGLTKSESYAKLVNIISTSANNVLGDRLGGVATNKAVGWLGLRMVTGAITTGIFTIYGAVDGVLSASLLFGIPQEDVTIGMRAVASVVKAFTSGFGSGMLDILLLFIKTLTGVDAAQWLAHMIYRVIGDDKVLDNALVKMENDRAIYNKENNTKLTADEYNQLMNGDTTIFGRLKKFGKKFVTQDTAINNATATRFETKAASSVYGIGDAVGYGGINMMSMGNAMRSNVRESAEKSVAKTAGDFFKYNGKKYKKVKDALGRETWQEMGFFESTKRYNEVAIPSNFDPESALAKGVSAKNLVNVDGKTYNTTYINNRIAHGDKYTKAKYNSSEMSSVNKALEKVRDRDADKSKKAKSSSSVKPWSIVDYGNFQREQLKRAGVDSQLTQDMLAHKYGLPKDKSDNPYLENGMGPNATMAAANKGTLKTADKIKKKIESGYQMTDNEYNFNRQEFYRGLKVADIEAMANYNSALLTDPKIPKFKAIYKYYVRSGRFDGERFLQDKEIESIFGSSDFVKSLGGTGTEGNYEYKYGFPFFQTDDPRWAGIDWRGTTVKGRGGDLASLAMIATAFGPNMLDPEYIYTKWIQKNKEWYDSEKGLKFDKVFADDGYPAQKGGQVNGAPVQAKKLMSANTILSYLKANKPVIMTGYRYRGGPFGGYYNRANAPTTGPDDYATIVARAANDAHMAVLNPYTALHQGGLFDIHALNDTIGKKGLKSIKEAYGITGPAGGGITGKVDLSQKGNQTSDYIDLSKEKGLGKITALFTNIANIVTNLFDAMLGSKEYVSIFEEKESEGGIDEADNGKGDGANLDGFNSANKSSNLDKSYASANLDKIDYASLPYGASTYTLQNQKYGTVQSFGNKPNGYLYRGQYYIQVSKGAYTRVDDEQFESLQANNRVNLVRTIPRDLLSGTARIYGATIKRSYGGSMGGSYVYETKGTNGKPNQSYLIPPKLVSGSQPLSPLTTRYANSAHPAVTMTTDKDASVLSGIQNWFGKLGKKQSTMNIYQGQGMGYGGGDRDLVFYGPGDVIGYGKTDAKKKLEESKHMAEVRQKGFKDYEVNARDSAHSTMYRGYNISRINWMRLHGYKDGLSDKEIEMYNEWMKSNTKSVNQLTSSDIINKRNERGLITSNALSAAISSGLDGTVMDGSAAFAGGVQYNIPEIQKYMGATQITSGRETPKYLAMHYTTSASSPSGSAKGICDYWNTGVNASADFVVDDGEIWQYNPDITKNFCWAVGDSKASPGSGTSLGATATDAGNPNVISIEMQSSNKSGAYEDDPRSPNWYFTDSVLNNSAGLAAKIMNDYNIPDDNLIMHHHVSGKICPGPWARSEADLQKYYDFKKQVLAIKAGGGVTTGNSSSSTETTTTTEERDFSKLPSSVRMAAIINAGISAALGDNYQEAKKHYLEQAYDQYFGGPETTTTTTTTPGTFDSNGINGSSGSGFANLDPGNVPQSVWNYFTSKGYSEYGTAGIMGNMNHESGMIVNRKQGDFSNGYAASAQYTQAADSGAIDFVNDSIGYGLVQFTYHTLKQSLLNRAKSEGKSVGDLGVQLDEIDSYLNGNGLAGRLKSASSVRQASDIFLHEYERPADQSVAVEQSRAAAGESFFNQFAGKGSVGNGLGDIGKIYKYYKPLSRSRAIGYGGNWLEICAEVKRQMNAQCAAKGQWYSWYNSVPINVNGFTADIRQDCSGYVGGCLAAYGCPAMLNTSTTSYYRGNQDLINAGFKDMDWPGQSGLLPGDIIVDTSPGAGGHVEVYAGNGQVYSAGSDAAIQNPGTTGISRSSYPVVWRPTDAGSVGSIADSNNATSSNTTTTTTSGAINTYMDPFSRMLGGLGGIVLQTIDGKPIAFGPGDRNPQNFFTNTLGGKISSNYGKRSSKFGNEFHRGVDIQAPKGRKIYSPISGKLVSKGNDVAGYGNYAVVRDNKGKNHLFAHMNNETYYGLGDNINQFDVIGEVGSSGKSTGSHLHYEIRNNGNKYSTIDPTKYSYDSDVSKSLNIHNAARSNYPSHPIEGSAVGSGNRDITPAAIADRLEAASNTEVIADKMDAIIDALKVMVTNTSRPVQPATSTITQNNTTVYGPGDKKKTQTKTIEKKETSDTREDKILAGIHKTIAKRR